MLILLFLFKIFSFHRMSVHFSIVYIVYFYMHLTFFTIYNVLIFNEYDIFGIAN